MYQTIQKSHVMSHVFLLPWKTHSWHHLRIWNSSWFGLTTAKRIWKMPWPQASLVPWMMTRRTLVVGEAGRGATVERTKVRRRKRSQRKIPKHPRRERRQRKDPHLRRAPSPAAVAHLSRLRQSQVPSLLRRRVARQTNTCLLLVCVWGLNKLANLAIFGIDGDLLGFLSLSLTCNLQTTSR